MRKSELKIEKVMHPMPHTIGDHETLAKAKAMMMKYGIRHLPVRRGGAVVGILTDRDINYVLSQETSTAEEILIKDSYIEDPYIVEPNVSVRKIARTMADERFGCAIVAENEKLLGIFTTVDACSTLADLLSDSDSTD